MALEVPNQAEVFMLQSILGQNLDLRLFKNNHVPAETDTEADYIEADFPGYVLESLVSGNWVITPGDPASAAYPDVVFTNSAGGSQFVYGYYITRNIDGKLMWAEQFSDNDPTAPYEMVNIGDTITVPLRFTLKDTTD